MKPNPQWLILIMLLLGLILIVVGCQKDDDDDETTTTTTTSSNFFYTSARETAPAIGSASSSTIGSPSIMYALTSGTLMYVIYEVLRDYQYPRDEGVIDMHNIYKVIYTAGQIYATAETGCSTIAEAVVASPYNMGLSHTYDCAGNSNTMSNTYANGYAIKKSTTDTKYGLLSYRWAPDTPTHEEHGILQGSYNATTGDLTLRMLHHVYYQAQEGFVVRTHITGNAVAHTFEIQMISTGTGGTPTWTSVVGKGISQGSGNYFLFKVRNNSVTDNYICFPATATESVLETMHASAPNGKTTVDAGCSSYQTAVDAMTFLTTTNVPKQLSDFVGSSILLAY